MKWGVYHHLRNHPLYGHDPGWKSKPPRDPWGFLARWWFFKYVFGFSLPNPGEFHDPICRVAHIFQMGSRSSTTNYRWETWSFLVVFVTTIPSMGQGPIFTYMNFVDFYYGMPCLGNIPFGYPMGSAVMVVTNVDFLVFFWCAMMCQQKGLKLAATPVMS